MNSTGSCSGFRSKADSDSNRTSELLGSLPRRVANEKHQHRCREHYVFPKNQSDDLRKLPEDTEASNIEVRFLLAMLLT